jgi:hypothetical protein
MNPILLFVLGTLSGSVLIGIIYTIFWMVRTHKNVNRNAIRIEAYSTASNNDYQSLYDKIKKTSDDIDDSISRIYIKYDSEIQELNNYITSAKKEIHSQIGDTDYHLRELHHRDIEELNRTIHSYIDSRIDKQYDRINMMLSEIGQKN